MNIFLLDNHDSFTYNLAALIRNVSDVNLEIGQPETANIASLRKFDKIVFSPGPGLPHEFPIMFDIIDAYKNTKSFLGVCLGHQMIVEYFGGKLQNLNKVNHGWEKSLKIVDEKSVLFKNVPNNTSIGVYHSWYAEKTSIPGCLKITAECENQLVMALQHNTLDIHSVQFHPESFITTHGKLMIENWVKR